MSLLLLALAACRTAPEGDVATPGLDRRIASWRDTGVSAPDTGETRDSGDSGAPGDTSDSGDTSIAADSADSGASTDSGDTSPPDTGPSSDTGDTADSGALDTSLPRDTSVPPDTGGSDTSVPVETGGTTVDTAPPTIDTSLAIVDTGSAWPSGDTATSTADTAPGSDTSTTVVVIPGDTADSALVTDSADTGKTTTTAGDTGLGLPLSDTAAAADTAAIDTAAAMETAAATTDTSVYFPSGCDTADTAACSSVIRFVALGDAGTGDRRQTDVASAIEAICVLDGCDFALYLGDNIYGGGPTDVADVQWTTKFEVPYAGLGFLFWAVLGNHDYGGGYDTATAAVEVAYTGYSTKWSMPARYYTEPIGDITVLALDTQAMQLGHGADQDAWISGAVAAISTTWTIAIGHHPYVSNGPHGNAGEFDGMAGSGQPMKDFFDAYVCGVADVYLAGHDHALQWMDKPAGCDTEFIVAGGGGSGTYPIVGSNPALYEDSTNGFLWVEIDGAQFTGVFYDSTGAELYRRVFTK